MQQQQKLVKRNKNLIEKASKNKFEAFFYQFHVVLCVNILQKQKKLFENLQFL